MKILEVCLTYGTHIGGVTEHVRNISERLSRYHEVEVCATDPTGKMLGEKILNGIKVKRFKSWAPNGVYYFSGELKRYLMKNSDEYNVVHAHSYHAFPALYAAQSKGTNKLVFSPHYHGGGHTFFRSFLHIPYKFLGRKIFEKADKVVCVSNYEKSLIQSHFKIDDEKITITPNGVDLQEFKDLKKRRKDFRVILYVGRLEKYKGVDYLIKALPKLNNDIQLEIVGKGPYKKNLLKLMDKLRVMDRVNFYQNLPRIELLQRYADADLFVLLSKHEAFGISVAEALASKTPCIVVNTSALKEWVDNKNCFGINYPIDTKELAKLMNEVIGRDVRKMKLLDWNDVVSRLIKVYEEGQK